MLDIVKTGSVGINLPVITSTDWNGQGGQKSTLYNLPIPRNYDLDNQRFVCNKNCSLPDEVLHFYKMLESPSNLPINNKSCVQIVCK
jgi:hypothetical protein